MALLFSYEKYLWVNRKADITNAKRQAGTALRGGMVKRASNARPYTMIIKCGKGGGGKPPPYTVCRFACGIDMKSGFCASRSPPAPSSGRGRIPYSAKYT